MSNIVRCIKVLVDPDEETKPGPKYFLKHFVYFKCCFLKNLSSKGSVRWAIMAC